MFTLVEVTASAKRKVEQGTRIKLKLTKDDK